MLILFKMIESIDMTLCVISFLVNIDKHLLNSNLLDYYSRDAYQYFYCFLYILNNFPRFYLILNNANMQKKKKNLIFF